MTLSAVMEVHRLIQVALEHANALTPGDNKIAEALRLAKREAQAAIVTGRIS